MLHNQRKEKEINESWQKAVTLTENKEYDEALSILFEVLKKNPRHPRIISVLIQIYYHLQNYEMSIAYYDQYVEISDYHEIHSDRAQYYAARTIDKTGDSEKSRGIYNMCCWHNSIFSFKARVRLAVLLRDTNYLQHFPEKFPQMKLKSKHLEAKIIFENKALHKTQPYLLTAFTRIQEVIELQPENTSHLLLKGLIQKKQENYQDALNTLLDVIERDNTEWTAQLNIGYCLFKLERYSQAADHFRIYLESNPDKYKIFFKRGLALDFAGNEDEAIGCFKEAIKINSKNINEKAKIYLKTKITQKGPGLWVTFGPEIYELKKKQIRMMIKKTALQWFEEANEKFLKGLYQKAALYYKFSISLGMDNNGNVWFNYGNALMAKGKLDEAIEAFDASLMYLPDDPDIHNNKGSLLSRKGEYSKAINSFTIAIKLDKMYIPAYINMANNYYMMKDMVNAANYYRMAIEMDEREINALLGIAKVLIVQGSHEDALKESNNALNINPKNHVALRTKGIALLYLENIEEAIIHIDQSLEIEPEDFDSNFWKSLVLYLSNGGQNEANRIYTICKEKNPENTESWVTEITSLHKNLFSKYETEPPTYYN